MQKTDGDDLFMGKSWGVTESDWTRIHKGIIHKNTIEEIASEGLYRGGEQMLERALPPNVILPLDLETVIQAGVQALSNQFIRVESPAEVALRIQSALQEKRGFALIRFGDGELLTLAQGTVRSVEEVIFVGHFLEYAGVCVPDWSTRNQLERAVRRADVVGIPRTRKSTFQILFHDLVKYYGWPLQNMCFTSSVINYELGAETNLYCQLLQQYSVVLVGNRMQELSQQLVKSGYTSIAGVVPVQGAKSVHSVMEQLSEISFDVALVSAGVAANLICVGLKDWGKTAIDFGHLADRMLKHGRTV